VCPDDPNEFKSVAEVVGADWTIRNIQWRGGPRESAASNGKRMQKGNETRRQCQFVHFKQSHPVRQNEVEIGRPATDCRPNLINMSYHEGELPAGGPTADA
jgi:hypothetical protein